MNESAVSSESLGRRAIRRQRDELGLTSHDYLRILASEAIAAIVSEHASSGKTLDQVMEYIRRESPELAAFAAAAGDAYRALSASEQSRGEALTAAVEQFLDALASEPPSA